MSKPFVVTELTLDEKIALAENIIIEEYAKTGGNLFISWSGGKDSEVLKHIALRLFPHLPVVYSNTTNEMKEVLEHVKKFPDTIVVFPDKNFKQVIKTEGFPLISKEVSQKAWELKNINGYRTRMLRYYGDKKGNSKLPDTWHFLAEQEFDVSSKCCYELKKKPLDNWAKANGNPKPLIALMSGESRLRQQLALYGAEDGKKVYPFLRTEWNEDDIWEYARRNNIRFAECYYDRVVDGAELKACNRSGCGVCNFSDYEEREKKSAREKALNPKRYASLIKTKNNGVMYEKAIEIADKKISNTYLGLFGTTVKEVKFNKITNSEIYVVTPAIKPYNCPCCGKRGTKSKEEFLDCGLVESFNDTPNPNTGRKRVIEIQYSFFTCKECGMTLNNHLHMFDMRFRVTKRVIDYIYQNLGKKSELELADEIGMDYMDVCEIIEFNYSKAFKEAKENHRASVWFNEDNELIA